MNDLPTKNAVFILQYDRDNSFGASAAARARETVIKIDGTVKLSEDVFILDIAKAFPVLTELLISQDRRFLHAVGVEGHHLHFVLVPCQSPVVGALTAELKKKLAALGLTNWEIGYPSAPREGGR